jgi:hypothetical protein
MRRADTAATGIRAATYLMILIKNFNLVTKRTNNGNAPFGWL